MKSAIFLILIGLNVSISVVTSAILIWMSAREPRPGRTMQTIATGLWSFVICAVPAWLIWIVLNYKK